MLFDPRCFNALAVDQPKGSLSDLYVVVYSAIQRNRTVNEWARVIGNFVSTA